jgi:hypothetical protein
MDAAILLTDACDCYAGARERVQRRDNGADEIISTHTHAWCTNRTIMGDVTVSQRGHRSATDARRVASSSCLVGERPLHVHTGHGTTVEVPRRLLTLYLNISDFITCLEKEKIAKNNAQASTLGRSRSEAEPNEQSKIWNILRARRTRMRGR